MGQGEAKVVNQAEGISVDTGRAILPRRQPPKTVLLLLCFGQNHDIWRRAWSSLQNRQAMGLEVRISNTLTHVSLSLKQGASF